MLDHYRRLLAYNGWANAQTLASLQNGTPPPRAVRWMSHIVGSEYTWLSRVQHQPPPLDTWPELDIDGCASHVAELADIWRQVAADLSLDALSEDVAYRNTKGEFWTSSVADIFTHVMLHSGYHRGQIAAEVRETGGTPATTDFIHAVRQRYIP